MCIGGLYFVTAGFVSMSSIRTPNEHINVPSFVAANIANIGVVLVVEGYYLYRHIFSSQIWSDALHGSDDWTTLSPGAQQTLQNIVSPIFCIFLKNEIKTDKVLV